ncbi:MAG TPA: HIT domain-containing protein [Myxococcales bacterium]|nr:HIT domain-containing protein [Myxococcales bacterium]
MDCIFCKIAAGRVPVKLLAQDDQLLAFPDIDPQAPVHALIIPRRHVESLKTVDDFALLGRMHQMALHISKQAGIYDSGFRTVINTGLNGVQTVLHLHLHLLGGRAMRWPPG